MGCVASRIDQLERVRVCKERKRLMKQLLEYRKQFANSQLAYLRSLKNTGATLRQFTESDSLEPDETASAFGFPPSPPPPLPPSPPPPPTFSPDLRQFGKKPQVQEIVEIDEDGSDLPPPPLPNSSWEYWDPFTSSPQCGKNVGRAEEEKWADTNSEFLDDEEVIVDNDEVRENEKVVELVDDSSLIMSWKTKDMVVWRSKRSLSGVVKDLDEYFLKASTVVKDIAVFIDIEAGGTFTDQGIRENNRKRSNPAKAFSALTWNRSSRSLQSTRRTGVFSEAGEPCKPGAHCYTLQKLYSHEQKLYKDVKDEEIAKMELGRKSLLLQRQEEEHEWAKIEKTRTTVESLRSYISSLQESISNCYSSILKIINEELHHQLIALASGLMHLWQTMHNCHEAQLHISQQINQVTDQQTGPTSEFHRQAAAQLQTEVTSWYHCSCQLVKFQQEYVACLNKWVELTSSLTDSSNPHCRDSSTVRQITQKWMQSLDKLPDKMVSEAINGLLSAVQSIVLQQQVECNIQKRYNKLVRKLERELSLLSELEMKLAGTVYLEDSNSVLVSRHPLVIRRSKVEALKALVDAEKAKHANSVEVTSSMILSNLKTSLPIVFQALMVYSSAYVQCFQDILGNSDVKSDNVDVKNSN